MKELTEEEFDAIREGYPLDGGDDYVEWNYEEIDEHFVKHDVTSYEFVFQNPADSKWYRGWYSTSYNYGMDSTEFPIELEEVRKVQVMTTVWEKV